MAVHFGSQPLSREGFWIEADGARLKGYLVFDPSYGDGPRPCRSVRQCEYLKRYILRDWG